MRMRKNLLSPTFYIKTSVISYRCYHFGSISSSGLYGYSSFSILSSLLLLSSSSGCVWAIHSVISKYLARRVLDRIEIDVRVFVYSDLWKINSTAKLILFFLSIVYGPNCYLINSKYNITICDRVYKYNEFHQNTQLTFGALILCTNRKHTSW